MPPTRHGSIHFVFFFEGFFRRILNALIMKELCGFPDAATLLPMSSFFKNSQLKASPK
jgi:hypothetical protein